MNHFNSHKEGDIKSVKKSRTVFSPVLEKVLLLAEKERQLQGFDYVSVHHLLIAMRQENKNHGAILMDEYGITLEQLRNFDYKDRRKKWYRFW